MNINMEGIDKENSKEENSKEENIELHSLKGANSERPGRHRPNNETHSLPQELKTFFVKIRIVAQYSMLGIMIFWFLFSLVSPLFRSGDSANSSSIDLKRVDDMLGTLSKIVQNLQAPGAFAQPSNSYGVRLGAIQARNESRISANLQ